MKRASNGLRKMPWRSAGLIASSMAMLVAASSAAAATPETDPFYRYTGSTPLGNIAPGTVLKTRNVPYHLVGFPLLLVKATQLLYRSTGQLGQPTVNVTSVIQPLFSFGQPKLVSYQSFYDSLNPDDEPSYAISGGLTLGGLIPNVESLLIAPLLQQGYSINIPDTEGQQADFAAGPEYGMNTLDSVRATFNSPATGVVSNTKVALIGYSGGAIASEWAAELAPTYAPDVASRMLGTSIGGVLVAPMHNLHYVEGSSVWAGIMPAALAGAARAFHADLTPYLNDDGNAIVQKLQKASIINVLGQYPGLTWAAIANPRYAQPEQVPLLVELTNELIMGTAGTPSSPMLITQGNAGQTEGTAGNQPGIGAGDGVMIAGDVRSLARQYCARGVKVQYNEISLDHLATTLTWIPQTLQWVNDRFANIAAPQDCSQIAAGNSLAPTPAP